MNILFIGNTNPDSTSRFYADSFEKLGHNVVRYDPRSFHAPTLFHRFRVRMRKAPLPKRVDQIHREITHIASRMTYDLVFVMAENFLPLESILHLKTRTKNLVYHSHDNNFAPGVLKPPHFFMALNHFDAVFTTKSQNVSKYKERGQANAIYIPSAFDPGTHRPIPKSQSKLLHTPIEVSFIGTFDHSRIPILNAVGWEGLRVWGNGWKRFKEYNSLKNRIVPRAIYNDEFADVISQSFISLGLLREEANDLHTQRTFEIPACGTLQIAPRNEEILSFFEEDKEIVCFESLEELQEKTTYYLNRDRDRSRIAKAGFERVSSSKHTYLDRARTILDSQKP